MFNPEPGRPPAGIIPIDPPFELARPAERTLPLVFASPHSGRCYPEEFVSGSRLDSVTIRRSEDAFVDELFDAVPGLGAPLLKARFPRAYLDPNREPWELDPEMFDGPLPDFVNKESPRVAVGLGTVARVVTDGEGIYRRKLAFAEAEWRVKAYYEPYHAALKGLIDETVTRFGACILIDCHSMPSVGGPMDSDRGRRRADFVLGDCYGSSCATTVIAAVESHMAGLGYRPHRNIPYSGGHTTRHYGSPEDGVHALQIEINRDLYMNEADITRIDNLSRLRSHMTSLAEVLGRLDIAALKPRER